VDSLKIGHFDNMSNVAYTHVQLLRRYGYDAELGMSVNSHPTCFPQWEEGDFEIDGVRTTNTGVLIDDIRNGKVLSEDQWPPTPSWVHYFDSQESEIDLMKLLNPIKNRKNDGKLTSSIINNYRYLQAYLNFKMIYPVLLMQNYDILHCWSGSLIYAPYSGRPYIGTPLGGDLILAIKDTTKKDKLFRKGFQRAKKVISHDPGVEYHAKRIGIKDFQVFPFAIDTEKYRPIKTTLRDELVKQYNTDYIVFNPSRQSWRWKGNDRMVKAFSRFVENKNDSLLVLASWGDNIDKTRSLVDKLNLKDKVLFIPTLGKKRLIEYYNASDVVIDQLNTSELFLDLWGLVTIEAMACGTVALTDCDLEAAKVYYSGTPPVQKVKETDEIYETLI